MAKPYLDLLRNIYENGVDKDDRTGVGTRSIFGAQVRFDLTQGFPLLTTKKLPFRWIAEELLWMLSGSTNEADLRAKGVDIWKEWATKEQCARFGREEGDLGPIYGWQWRRFGEVNARTLPGPLHTNGDSPMLAIQSGPVEVRRTGVDQIADALLLLEANPDSRRIIVTGWNPAEATKVALPPCHTIFQFETHARRVGRDVGPKRALSCHMYMRSADVFLGVPFNIASYALLTHLFAHVLDYLVGDLIVSFGDVHIYRNHFGQVEEQLSREPKVLPNLRIEAPHLADVYPPVKRLLGIGYAHLKIRGYSPHPKIAAPVAV